MKSIVVVLLVLGLIFVPLASAAPDRLQVLAFNEFDPVTKTVRVGLVNADGSGERILGDTEKCFDPNISADGQRLMFCRSEPGVSRVEVLTLADGRVARLHNSDDAAYGLTWSPDQKRVAYYILDDGDNPTPWMFVMNADGTGARRVGPDRSMCPQWSSDGNSLVFAWFDNKLGTAGVSSLDVSSGRVQKLYENSQSPIVGVASSPDGKRIAFIKGEGENSQIHLMNAAGSNVTRLTSSPFIHLGAQFSRDGKTVFVSRIDRHSLAGGIVAINLENGTERPLVSAPRPRLISGALPMFLMTIYRKDRSPEAEVVVPLPNR